ncbi:MAG: PEGA domain-containing protein [Bacteroidia bacterium]|nr:PEGA domain-containing protein [Bacteroidia bacterium]
MKTIKPNWIICTLIFISMSSFAQNPSIFILQTLPVDNTYLAEKCNTSDLIIFISCKIPGLSFESNVIKTDSFKQFFNPDREEYIICHSMEPFMLTINCPGYESRDEPIDGLKSRYKFKITGKLVMGVVNFISKPKGASVQFFGMTEFPTPSTQRMATGEYPATMRKNGYKTLDTTVVFSPDVTKDLTFELKPDFPSLKFDIQSIDSLDFTEPPVLIVDTDTIILDGYVNKGKKLASFDNDLAYNTVIAF